MRNLVKICALLLGFITIANVSQAAAWKLARTVWTEQDEKAYGDFVERLCDSKHGNLNKFIKDPKANPFYGAEDQNFNLSPDCADLPYMIRAYVAYKLRLPFSYVSEISGGGGDERYSKGNKAKEFKDQDYFNTPQQLFYQVALINSGYFRMSATSENSDHYPIKISKKTLTPGTIYYDPDGHVAIVAKVYDNGRIRLIDAHPDKSISKPWFGTKFSKGNKTNGGGFKKWRQIRYTSDGRIIRTQNHNLPDYSENDQYSKNYNIRGKTVGYHEYIRLSMATGGAKSDPMSEFIFMMQDIYEDIRYRALAVDTAIQKGCHLKPHPGSLPRNIYGTDGIWEELSTPSRDARLKVAFREFYDTTRQMVMNVEESDPETARRLAYAFLLKYDELSPHFSITYTNSAGRKIALSFADVNSRLFDLSFDPYHSIEYRWGAKGQELASANDGETKRKFYAMERTLRNQLERVYGCPTPLSMGPEYPVSVDVRGWLYAYVQGAQVDKRIIAFSRERTEDEGDSISQKSVSEAKKGKKLQPKEEIQVKTPVEIETSMEIASEPQIPATRENVQLAMQNLEEDAKEPSEEPQEIQGKANIKETYAANSSMPKAEVQQANNELKTSESKPNDFWGGLLSAGDVFASAISNEKNYVKTE